LERERGCAHCGWNDGRVERLTVLDVVVVRVDGGDLTGWIEEHDFGGEQAIDAGVVEGDAVDASEDGVELEVEIGVSGEPAGEVGSEGGFAGDASGVVAEDFHDEGRVKDYVGGVVLEDAVEVVAVPCIDPGLGETDCCFFGNDHGASFR